MKRFLSLNVLAVSLIISFAQYAKADVVMLAADQTDVDAEEAVDHNRYERDLEYMNSVSDQVAAAIMNRGSGNNVEAGNKNDNLQVKLIRVRR